MKRKSQPAPPVALEQLRARVEHWRRTRSKLSPMPAPLWRAAERLAEIHGCAAVARATGIDYGSLRERGSRKAPRKATAGLTPTAPPKPRFVELSLPSEPRADRGMKIELEDREGVKMTVRIDRESAVDIATLASAIWERRR